ncbi:hypothetical protein L6164_027456 [Bauhinia variegata]|uniref:Uncharacterized protein n=1 Tax=Bauhinia variegata TaxID=167791 RepID=A0ACB9LTE3_BAUVA|nr:hypothetical protein L6164_027456 [Bauhinia variegata]
MVPSTYALPHLSFLTLRAVSERDPFATSDFSEGFQGRGRNRSPQNSESEGPLMIDRKNNGLASADD